MRAPQQQGDGAGEIDQRERKSHGVSCPANLHVQTSVRDGKFRPRLPQIANLETGAQKPKSGQT
jgi:hypothetical protein